MAKESFIKIASAVVLTFLAPIVNTVFAQDIVQDVAQRESLQIPDELKTVAEKSDFKSTSLSDEVVGFLDECAKRADHVTRNDFGKTVDGKPMVSAIIANPPYKLGEADDRLVAFVLGNIHSGECAGKEALLMLMRELTLDKDHPLLKKLVIIIAPNYNADGNDKIAKRNRPGQVGPENGMGVRPNSMNFDLNREFIKLESPEARNLIAYFNKANPEMFIDCHTTNGSIHRYELTYDIPHNPATSEMIRTYMRGKMMPEITSNLEDDKIDTFYYGNFNRGKNRWSTYGYEPRYSTEYFGMRGGIGILSEAYSYISYKDRIFASKAFVEECLEYASRNTKRLKNLVKESRNMFVKTATEAPDTINFPLAAKMTAFDGKFVIKGLDGEEDKDYMVDFYGNYQPTKSRPLPFAYVFPPELKEIANHAIRHGAKIESLDDETELAIESYSIKKVQQSRRAFQGHRMMSVEVEMKARKMSVPKGAFIVRTGQPLGRLMAYMLEPESVDGVVTWNFLDDEIEEGKTFPIHRIPQPVELETSTVDQLDNVSK